MGAALVLLLVGIGALAAGVLIGRYYVPDDRQLRRSARHSRAYMRALSHLIARDHETAVTELRAVVEDNVDDVEPYFALGAMFRSRGEHERAIRVHQALAMRERDKRKLRQRAMYELGLDFRAAGMPRRATRAMEEVMLDDASHEGAARVLAALYEEQARFNEAAGLWQRIGRRRGEDTGHREHHLLIAAAQAAIGRDDLDSAKELLKAAQKHEVSAHFYAAAAELAAARDNHRGAKERLRQALVADPGLAPHLLPGLIAAEQGLARAAHGGHASVAHADELADEAAHAAPPLAAGSIAQLAAAPATSGLALAPTSESGARLPAISASSMQLPLVSASSSQLAASAGSSSQLAAASASSSQLAAASASSSQLLAASADTLEPAPALEVAGTAGGTAASAAAIASPLVTAGPLAAAHAASLAQPVATASLAQPTSLAPPVATAQSSVTAGPAPATPAQPAVIRLQAEVTPRAADDGASHAVGPAGVAASPAADGGGHAASDGNEPAIAGRVLALLAEVERETGPRLELVLVRAQLVPVGDGAAQAALAAQLIAQFPASLAARVAAARLASASHDAAAIHRALDGLVSDTGALAWALRGRWQCANCGHRPGAFSWRCGQCRRWSTLRMETGIEPPPVAPRERRAAPRAARLESLLGAAPDLPAATLDPGLSDAELATAGVRRSLLGRVGGWVSGRLRRDA